MSTKFVTSFGMELSGALRPDSTIPFYFKGKLHGSCKIKRVWEEESRICCEILLDEKSSALVKSQMLPDFL